MNHIWVTVQNLKVHKDGGSWQTIAVNTQPFDLKAIEGIEQFLASKVVEAGRYTQLRLEVGSVEVETATEKHDATVPSGEIKLVGTFEVVEGKTTVVALDFDGEKSVIVTGGGKYIFKPVIKLLLTKQPQRNLDITTASLPNGAMAVAYNATLEASAGVSPYTWSISAGNLPAGLTLNSATGAISGTPTTAGNYEFTVKVEDKSSPVQSSTKKFSIRIAAAGALIITTTSLPDGKLGAAYSATVAAIGGTTPYTWSTSADSLPAGLTLNSATGAISGTPTNKGNYEFTIKVEDKSTPLQSDNQKLSIRIAAAAELTITTNSLPEGKVGTAYSATVEATGGVPPYTWSISAGSLPAGLTLNPTTGAISGTPTAAGNYEFTVKVEDKSTPAQSDTQNLSIMVSIGT